MTDKTIRQQVIARAREIYKLHPEMTGRQVADFIRSEFPSLTDRTVYDYCKPSSVGVEYMSDTPEAVEEYSPDYFYNALDDVYLVFSPFRGKPIIITGDQHRGILKAYSNDGDGATQRDCAESFGFELKEMRWYLRAFKHEHGSLPFSDEEVADSIGDEELEEELVKKGLAIQRGKIARNISKKNWRQTIKKAQAFESFEAQSQLIATLMGETLVKYKQPDFVVTPAGPKNSKLAVLPLYDIHIGKNKYDGRGTPFPRDTVNDLMQSTDADSVLIVFGGDYFHVDTTNNATTAGTRQDMDSHPGQMLKTGYEEAVTTALDALGIFSKVQISVVAGNHDHMACMHMIEFFIHLTHWMRLAGHDIQVVTGADENLVVIEHGINLIAFEHGDGPKPAKLIEVLHTNYRKQWGRTENTYAHTGHLHHAYERDLNGGIVMQQPTSAKADRWHKKNGYTTAEAALRLYEYHEEKGLYTIHHRIVK
jgi:hypothetical protein